MILKRIPLNKLKHVRKWRLFVVLITLFWGCSETMTTPSDSQPFLAPAVAYQPRGFLPGSEKSLSRKRITEDLRLLRKSGFRSLVTYGAKGMLGIIPEIARNEGFDGMIVMGIWDIFSKEEWNNALRQAPFVDGYCLGNEGLGIRYRPDELASKMTDMRRLTGHPVTTSEQIENYLEGPYRNWLLSHSDWLFPIAHPFWHAQVKPNEAVNWIIARYDYLMSTTGKKVILKEAGFPTASSVGLYEESQITFFQALKATGISFYYFEAFDQPWKGDSIKDKKIEAHWGLHYADGTPKKVIRWIADQRANK
jgi:exo-beta-1,3-glucanase (GH17 family)